MLAPHNSNESNSQPYLKHDIFRHAYDGNTRIVLSMLDREPGLIGEIGELGNETCYAPSTLLHFACRAGHISLAYELVRVRHTTKWIHSSLALTVFSSRGALIYQQRTMSATHHLYISSRGTKLG